MRRQVQKEAKRVAELAAAAVLAAAASPDDNDEPAEPEKAVAGGPVGAHAAIELPQPASADPGKVTRLGQGDRAARQPGRRRRRLAGN